MEINIKKLPAIHEAVMHQNFRDMIDYAANTYKDDDAFILKKKKSDGTDYLHITYTNFRNDVRLLCAGLCARDFAGKRIAVIGNNSYEWLLAYLSALCSGGVSVPLDKGLPIDETVSSLRRSKTDVLFFDKGHSDMIKKIADDCQSGVSSFICMEPLEGFDDLRSIMRDGKNEDIDKCWSIPVDGDAMTILLFTSGTTSTSKAVMLSQKNVTSNSYGMLLCEDMRRGDVNMAFLPYHHTFGAGQQILMLAVGGTTVYCDGLKYIQKNLQEYGVTFFVCVPLLIEAIYKKIMTGIKKQGKEKAFERGKRISAFLLKLHIDMRKKIFKEVLDQLGGRIRIVISGASPLDPEVASGFHDIGIEVVQGYGMTEASPVIAAESKDCRRPGSIGFAMPNVDVKLIDINDSSVGQLIAKGPNIMLGYYNDDDATADTLHDGWLYTGDLASVDKDGYIYLRGRLKNVIVLKNGKNVYPEELETEIMALPFIKECMVYGRPRHKDGNHKDLALCANIVYDAEKLKGVADPDNFIRQHIDKINETLPRYKHIMRVNVTDQPMEKTTTGKIKRYKQNLD